MLTRVPTPRTLGVLLSLALGACGSQEGFGGTTGSFCTDAGLLQCCVGGCDGVTLAAPICDGSGWQCPGGSKLSAECADAGSFCLGPVCPSPVGFECCQGGCDGAATAPVCTSAGWECPSGSVNSQLCPGKVCVGSPTGGMDGPFGSE